MVDKKNNMFYSFITIILCSVTLQIVDATHVSDLFSPTIRIQNIK